MSYIKYTLFDICIDDCYNFVVKLLFKCQSIKNKPIIIKNIVAFKIKLKIDNFNHELK